MVSARAPCVCQCHNPSVFVARTWIPSRSSSGETPRGSRSVGTRYDLPATVSGVPLFRAAAAEEDGEGCCCGAGAMAAGYVRVMLAWSGCSQSGLSHLNPQPSSTQSLLGQSRTAPVHARRAHPRVQILAQVRGLGLRAQEARGGSACVFVCAGARARWRRYPPILDDVRPRVPNPKPIPLITQSRMYGPPPSHTSHAASSFTHQHSQQQRRPELRQRPAGAVRLGPGWRAPLLACDRLGVGWAWRWGAGRQPWPFQCGNGHTRHAHTHAHTHADERAKPKLGEARRSLEVFI